MPEIRHILPQESTVEAELIERAFAAGPYGHLPKSAERRDFERDTAGRAASGAVLVSVDNAGQVTGSASVLRAATPYSRVAVPGEAEIRLLAVDPATQGAGLGKALMRASLEAALEWGADALVLDTGAANTRAQALYERLGFDRVPAREAAVSSVEVEALVYRYALQQRDDVQVRLMRDDEAVFVSELVESAYAVDFTLTDDYRASIAAVGERARDHQVWVATDAASGALLGTVSTPRPGKAISPLAREGELDFRFLGVAAEARRSGIGALLVEHVLLLGRLRGVHRIVLNTGPEMVSAQRLYERLGFERLHEREFHFTRSDGSSFLMLAYGRESADATDAAAESSAA
ncbi:GNAT family N-acetyltransferase [Agromyces albus]|uniref:GNAT family N-acetyltransferase n=1 Tax=Agromyces albus TaxID=205332 RepID=UPI0027D7C961|nr:GNAT family N-acetyltransferase [Agromyces albus]